MERIVFVENFPIDGEAYAIFKGDGEYAFAWGPEWPFEDDLPNANILEGESGLQWFRTEEEARQSTLEAIEASGIELTGELFPGFSA